MENPSMHDIYLAVGKLEGKVDMLLSTVHDAHTPLNCPLRSDVDDLKQYRWKLAGLGSAIGAVFGAIVSWIFAHLSWGK